VARGRAAHHFLSGPLVGGNRGPGSGRHSFGARSMMSGRAGPRPAAKMRRHPASSQRRDTGNNMTRPSTPVTKPGIKRRIPPKPGAMPGRSNGAAAMLGAPAARNRVTSPLKCRRTNSPAKDISNSSKTAFAKPTAAETHTNATISTAGHASNPMAINLITRIAPNSFDRGPDLMLLPILRFGNAGTLCWRARLDGLSSCCIQKPGWAGKRFRPGITPPIPQYSRIGSKEE